MSVLRKILERKILIGLMVVLVFIVGVYSINKLDKELIPGIDFDMALVSVYAGDMPVLDVEERVTKPLEQLLSGTDGVESFQSNSATGSSSLYVEIEDGRLQDVMKDLEAGASRLEAELSEVHFIEVFPMSTDQGFEFYMELSDGSMDELSTFARNEVKKRLEAIASVREVRLSGIEEKEYVIEFDRDELVEHGLDMNQVISVLQQENIAMSLGELTEEENAPSLRWDTAFHTLGELEETMIPTMNGAIRLDEIADVREEANQHSSIAWKDGSRDFILIEIGRANGYTQLDMAEAVRAEVETMKEEGFPFSFTEIVAEADYVSSALDGVVQNILIGGMIALVILMLFLRNIRATIIVGLTIPVSILLTFSTMWIIGYSFNILTLVGLGLGIGMMVDASIVILESIYRKKEQGFVGMDAVVKGVREVATAVLASMLTTVVVFVPVGLFGGDFGVFILILSVVVVITLVSSVVVSFSLIPSLSENFLKLKRKANKKKRSSRIIEGYGRLIGWLSGKKRRRYSMIGLFFLIFVGSIVMTTKVPITLMPDVYDRYAELGIELESGLTPSERDEIVQAASEKLTTVPDVETSIFLDDVQYLFALINMTKGDEITTDQDEVNIAINEALRELEDEYPVKSVGMLMGPTGAAPIQLVVKGDDLSTIQELGDHLVSELEGIEGLVNVGTSIDKTSEERLLVLDEDALEEDGLTASEILGQLQGSFSTAPVGELVENGLTVPVVAKLDVVLDNEEALEEFEIGTLTGTEPLSNYMSLETIHSPLEISRDNGERYVTVSAEMEGRDLGSVSRDVQQVVADFDTPAGYTVEMAGDIELQQEMIMDLLIVLAISIFLVYFVMAVQFNSLVHPIIVMSVIPMTVIGAILALLITQSELSVFSALGLLMLIGIVLNNAILLIDRTKQLRNEGLTVHEAVKEAGKNRIRPIFMTTLTTVGGMLPLALATGSASAYQAPLATVIIGGLLFATVITLVLIPSVYLLFNDVGRGVKKIFTRKKRKKAESIEKAI
ncbi:efflux RND transporter permease subunit [Halalkalibacter sp. APA_J-10(15)]|uniref:efflux RND transporter permease subunit n=1 Tax=Halalkalibacter sp. APA_J-10(15) TaxID=2933805 RepID=UPI001FF52E9A|nr:efflux RND transporter permease subunit [Halalkalibacter sp. APA_J-10(15)]MCK0470475.1 efflux RND transporter permease subunit [Halalkalibacter sp. APA_J-10(15)]